MNFVRSIFCRLRVRWHAVIVTFSIALPVLLDRLQVIDFNPLLQRYMSPEVASVVIALLPFYIAMLKPMIKLEDREQSTGGPPDR